MMDNINTISGSSSESSSDIKNQVPESCPAKRCDGKLPICNLIFSLIKTSVDGNRLLGKISNYVNMVEWILAIIITSQSTFTTNRFSYDYIWNVCFLSKQSILSLMQLIILYRPEEYLVLRYWLLTLNRLTELCTWWLNNIYTGAKWADDVPPVRSSVITIPLVEWGKKVNTVHTYRSPPTDTGTN